ncbi:MAG: zinc ribbon domain-containing protein [Euryarchaeota archaeon]|nr:zinc ribbon domain-containing protein [Euryarchaeota archaeon]
MKDPKDGDQEGNDFEFDCPECGTHIAEGMTKCPKCGVEFVFEEVEEVEGVECPSCGTIIPAEADVCPKCDRSLKERTSEPEPEPSSEAIEPPGEERLDEAELKRLFPIYVSDVKDLMDIAKDHAIDTAECRSLIDRAVKAGKAKELAKAVDHVKACNILIKRKIEDRVTSDIEYLEKLSQIARNMGTDSAEIDSAAVAAKELLEKKDYEGALKETRAGRKISEKVTGKYTEARVLCDQLEAIIQNSERFYIDTREARRKLKEAQEAEEQGDWTMMGILAKKGKAELVRVLPEVTSSEIKRAKTQLMEAKAAGKDVSILVKILKDAGLAVKTERYDKALDYLIEFKSEMKRV